ncbi:hypothetical protein PFISCL1PPCAC_14969, partial [Pristionchus fissidentatus]
MFYCAIESAKKTEKTAPAEFKMLSAYSIFIVLEMTPFLKAIIAGLALSISLLVSFVIKLYWRMHRSLCLQKETTSVTLRTRQHLLCWALFLEIFLPIFSFFLPSSALFVGCLLSFYNKDLSSICLLFHNSHAFFVCLIIFIFGRRHKTSPTRMISEACNNIRKEEIEAAKLIENPVESVTKEQ